MKVAIVLLACVTYVMGACPRIVTRAQWGARSPAGSTAMSVPVANVVIHHAESAFCSTEATCSQLVRQFQDQHMDVNGWDDIGYSFLVGEDGNGYEGRGWNKVGAHAPNYNSISIGVCFIGNFMNRIPNAAAIATAKQLIQCGIDDRNVQAGHSLVGHRQVTSTDCPGDALYNEIKNWANYNPNP